MRDKRRLIVCTIFIVSAALATPRPARAWNPTAHQIVAYIAYRRLDPKVRHRVDELLRHHLSFTYWQARIKKGDPYVRSRPQPASPGNDEFDLNVFLLASIWADEIRNRDFPGKFVDDNNPPITELISPSPYRHRAWHFIGLPFSTDGTPTVAPYSPNIRDVLPILSKGVGNPELGESAQAYDLAWLIHLVGDAHDPMHCVNRFSSTFPSTGDSGGNVVKIISAGIPTTLHIYWDSLLGTYSVATFKKEADRIIKLYKPARPVDLSEGDWVEESFKVAKDFAYSIDQPGAGHVTKNYDREAKEIARLRVALAGYRLADILNERLK